MQRWFLNRDGRLCRAQVACVIIGISTFSTSLFALQDDQVAPADAVTEDEFLDWAKANAISIDDWRMNDEVAAYLEEVLADKRILFIGEPGHFFHEKYEVHLMLIRHLAKQGYRNIFVEGLGAAMAPVWDEIVQNGPGKDEAETTEEPGQPRDRLRQSVRGVMPGANTPEFRQAQRAEERCFYLALHELNRELNDPDNPLRIHPMDIDTMASGACAISIDDLLAKYEEEPSLDRLRELAIRPDEESPEDELARLEALRAFVVENSGGALDVLPPDDRAALNRHTDCLLETRTFFHVTRADGNMTRALVRREPAMYRQAKHALDALPDDAKCIMLAHHNHLSKVGADTTRARQPSQGEMIIDAYPDEVFSIWMLYDHGTHFNPMNPEPLEELPSNPDRIESILVNAGSTYLLPLGTNQPGEQYLDEKRTYSYFSWSETSTLAKQADALFFIDEITPLRK